MYKLKKLKMKENAQHTAFSQAWTEMQNTQPVQPVFAPERGQAAIQETQAEIDAILGQALTDKSLIQFFEKVAEFEAQAQDVTDSEPIPIVLSPVAWQNLKTVLRGMAWTGADFFYLLQALEYVEQAHFDAEQETYQFILQRQSLEMMLTLLNKSRGVGISAAKKFFTFYSALSRALYFIRAFQQEVNKFYTQERNRFLEEHAQDFQNILQENTSLKQLYLREHAPSSTRRQHE